MPETFDPYHRWLGIPSHEQPPNHYRLLGLQFRESDPEVIESAADRQMAHVRLQQSGLHAELARRVLNEIAAAKICLLDPIKRAEYEAQLAQPPPVAASSGILPAAPLAAPRQKDSGHLPAPPMPHTDATGNGGSALWIAVFAGLAVVCLVLTIGAVQFMRTRSHEPVAAVQPADPPTDVDAAEDKEPTQHRTEAGNSSPTNGGGKPAELPAHDVNDRPAASGTAYSPPPREPNPPVFTTDASARPHSPSGEEPSEFDRPKSDVQDEDQPTHKPAEDEPPAPVETAPADAAEIDEPTHDRLPVPSNLTRRQRQEQIQDLFELKKARSMTQKLELARKLAETGQGTRDDKDARFVLFNLARKLASEAGDLELAFTAIDELNKDFQIDADVVRVSSFDTASGAALPKSKRKTVVESGIKYVDDLLARDKYQEAAKLIIDLQRAARAIRNRELSAALMSRRKRGAALFEEYQQVRSALARLETDGDDAEANLAAGQFYCFAKGDWQRGLPMLAKGSDDALKKLAELEMLSPSGSKDQMKLADGWWTLASAGRGSKADVQRARALMWYQRVVSTLSGLNKIRVQKRIDDTADLELDGGVPFSTQIVRSDRHDDASPPSKLSQEPVPTTTKPAVTPPREVAGGKDLPNGAVLRLGSGRFTLGDKIEEVSVTADGKHVVAMGSGRIRMWNLRDGLSVGTAHVNLAMGARASGNGDHLALIAAPLEYGVKGQDFYILDLTTGKQLASFHFNGSSHSSAVSPDGQLVAIGGIDRFVSLVDPRTGDVLDKAPPQTLDPDGSISANQPVVSFAPNGAVLAVKLGDSRVRFFDIAGRPELREEEPITVDTNRFRHLTLSPQGDLAAMVHSGLTSLYNTRTGAQLATLQHPAKYSVMVSTFSPDGKLLAMFMVDYRLLLWDVTGARLVKEIRTPRRWGYIDALDFSRDGRKLLGSTGGRVLIWDVATGREESYDPTRDLVGAVTAVNITPDGRAIATADRKGTVSLWSKAARWNARPLPNPGTGRFDSQPSPDFLRFIHGGQTLIAGSCYRRSSINVWDVVSGRATAHFSGHAWPIVSVAVSERAGLIASTSRDESLRIWNSRGQQLRRVDNLDGGCVEFAPDGKSIAVASLRGKQSKSVRIIDPARGAVINNLVGHTAEVQDVAFSPDGTQLASSANDKTLRIWNFVAGESKIVIDLSKTVERAARQVAYSPDATKIASTSDDGYVYVWDAATGEQVAAFGGHDGKVECLAWRQDGRQLVSGGADASVLVWDVRQVLK